MVYAFVPGVNVPATPTVLFFECYGAHRDLLAFLTRRTSDLVCAPVALKFTVLPVIVYAFVPGVNVPATPTVPLEASVRAPVELLVRLLYANAGIVCATEPLKFTVLPVTVYAFVPGVKPPATPTVPLDG